MWYGCASPKGKLALVSSLIEIHLDIPAHSYQLTFEPNPRWPQFYASGKDIFNYWKDVVSKYGVDKYVRLSHKIIEARFNEASSKWHVKVCKVDSGEVFEDTADVLYNCIGALNEWKWPDIQGLHDFKGDLLHSANWDESWDATVNPSLMSALWPWIDCLCCA